MDRRPEDENRETRSGHPPGHPEEERLVRENYIGLAIGAIVLVILVIVLFRLLGGMC